MMILIVKTVIVCFLPISMPFAMRFYSWFYKKWNQKWRDRNQSFQLWVEAGLMCFGQKNAVGMTLTALGLGWKDLECFAFSLDPCSPRKQAHMSCWMTAECSGGPQLNPKSRAPSSASSRPYTHLGVPVKWKNGSAGLSSRCWPWVQPRAS